jgi:hypothetical protein
VKIETRMERREERKQLWFANTLANLWILFVASAIITAFVYDYMNNHPSDHSFMQNKNHSPNVITVTIEPR